MVIVTDLCVRSGHQAPFGCQNVAVCPRFIIQSTMLCGCAPARHHSINYAPSLVHRDDAVVRQLKARKTRDACFRCARSRLPAVAGKED